MGTQKSEVQSVRAVLAWQEWLNLKREASPASFDGWQVLADYHERMRIAAKCGGGLISDE